MANCDEFIFYDDLVREDEVKRRVAQKRSEKRAAAPAGAGKEASSGAEDRKQEVLDLVLETVEALIAERGEGEKVWGSMVKQALKRRKPGFRESYHGYHSFGELLEDAERRGLLKLERDERSGGHIIHLPGG
jgi:hypothetical protein